MKWFSWDCFPFNWYERHPFKACKYFMWTMTNNSFSLLYLSFFNKIRGVKTHQMSTLKKDWQMTKIWRRVFLQYFRNYPKVCIAYAQLHRFICTWTHDLMEGTLVFFTAYTRTILGHLSDSGYQLLRIGVRRPLTSSSQKLLTQFSPNVVRSIFRVRRRDIVNFITPRPKCKGR